MAEKEGKKNPVKNQSFQGARGMPDILPKDGSLWLSILEEAKNISDFHHFYFIETPILESAGVFERGVGEATDIVEKEMYVLKTRGGDRLALRPEGTAGVMRSYLEHHLGYFSSPLKVFYYGPMFRHERPQARRYRQFHQWGFEVIGDSDPVYDVSIVMMALGLLKNLKLKNLVVKLNTIGCRVCRPTYKQRLVEYYTNHKKDLCGDCLNRYEKNPLRLLDCKEAKCQELRSNAPIILDHLCQSCNNHFQNVLELMEDNNIDYKSDPYLVRGLDYYNKTVFEIFAGETADALASGGRYDYLAELLGGRMLPAVGVAVGVERVAEAMRVAGLEPKSQPRLRIFFAAVGEEAKKKSLRLMTELREAGIAVAESLGKKTFKAQLKIADKLESPLSLILGQKEVFEGTVIVRDMRSGAQETIPQDRMVPEIKNRLK